MFKASAGVAGARSNTSSHAYVNIRRPEQTFVTRPGYSILFSSSGVKHVTIFKVIGVIDRMIRNGDEVPWDDLPEAPPLGLGGFLNIEVPVKYGFWFELTKVCF